MMIVIVWILSKWTKMMTKTINSLFYPLISVTFFPIQNTLESSWNFPLLINISLCSHSRRNPAVHSQDKLYPLKLHDTLHSQFIGKLSYFPMDSFITTLTITLEIARVGETGKTSIVNEMWTVWTKKKTYIVIYEYEKFIQPLYCMI